MEATLTLFINKILATAAKRQASTIHLTVGSYPVLRIDDELVELKDEQVVTHDFIKKMADGWLNPEQKKKLEEDKAMVVTQELDKRFRLKINFFFQKNFLSISIRLIPPQVPGLVNLRLPKSIYSLTDRKSGLIIITGPYSSGRTTTAAAMIEEINKSRKENIITVEKPIEYLFTNKGCLIEQREVGRDVNSFKDAINYAKEIDVDVLMVESSNEPEIIPLILEFANAGRLCLLVMDANSATQAVEEILANFPPDEKERAQLLLSDSLLAIIAQRLLPRVGGGLILAAEVLIATEAVRSLIREGRIKQINTILQSSRSEGMLSLDQSLAELVNLGEVLIDQAIEYASNPESFRALAKA